MAQISRQRKEIRATPNGGWGFPTPCRTSRITRTCTWPCLRTLMIRDRAWRTTERIPKQDRSVKNDKFWWWLFFSCRKRIWIQLASKITTLQKVANEPYSIADWRGYIFPLNYKNRVSAVIEGYVFFLSRVKGNGALKLQFNLQVSPWVRSKDFGRIDIPQIIEYTIYIYLSFRN